MNNKRCYFVGIHSTMESFPQLNIAQKYINSMKNSNFADFYVVIDIIQNKY